jgi:hypothetical protein
MSCRYALLLWGSRWCWCRLSTPTATSTLRKGGCDTKPGGGKLWSLPAAAAAPGCWARVSVCHRWQMLIKNQPAHRPVK